MGVLILLFVTSLVPCVFCQEAGDCFGAGSVAGAAIGAFIAALLLVAVAYYLRKLYWRSKQGKHLVFTTDPESVKDEFAFDNPGFKQEEKTAWQHEAPTLPLVGKGHVLQAEFTKPEQSKDDTHLQRARVRRVKLWARDFTGLGLRCSGGAREGVHIHSVLRSGPAAAANLQAGDKIKSIKIEFTGTPLEDAVAILSLASPYPVELEVVEGGRVSGIGRGLHHPLLKRAGSTGDVSTLEKEGRLLHPPRSPNTSHSNSSTLETIKKVITEKIIPSATLERSKKERKDGMQTTLERENEKNTRLVTKNRFSDVTPVVSKPERNKSRNSTGNDFQTVQAENGILHNVEHLEVQKKDNDPKRGMKFGIRVLPPNVPDDGVLKQKNVENGVLNIEKKAIDEPDNHDPRKPPPTPARHEIESEVKKPAVTKRREKMAPPVPNARIKHNESDMNTSCNTSTTSEISSTLTTFSRSDLNSSGIKRDENGIPQELPQHMMDAAKAARNNRKSSVDLLSDKDTKEKLEFKREEAAKPTKKSKGKAPSPPLNTVDQHEKNKTDDSIIQQMKSVTDFLQNEKQHSSLLHDSSIVSTNRSGISFASTPKQNKTMSSLRLEESINFSQDDIDDIVSKPFKKESDSLNNFYEDTKSNLSSNQDGHSVMSLNQSEKGSTTIELNNSDITIHSSPTIETIRSLSDNGSLNDENERRVSSLGDLSKFEPRFKPNKPSTGTLERAQSLDISGEGAENIDNSVAPKKRKAMSVVETTFLDSGTEDILSDMVDTEKGYRVKEPRLSLNITKNPALEGLNTFQKNRLKKGSEFGNLEDAIVKDVKHERHGGKGSSVTENKSKEPNYDTGLVTHETSDHLAKRIMDENMKVHLKLVSEFAKSTSDGSNMSSLDSSQESQTAFSVSSPIKYEEKVAMSYDTNVPDDLKVSRNTYVNSLERPKSEMMKKLLAKNPILNLQQGSQSNEVEISTDSDTKVDSRKSLHHPDIVNFDLKSSNNITRDDDEFVSNIRVGSNNSTLNHKKTTSVDSYSSSWSERKDIGLHTNNIVTVLSDTKPHISQERNTYRKSIDVGESTLKLIPDVIEDIKNRKTEKGSKTLYMEPANMSITMMQEPVQKTVTVNVTEDEFGNKVITQNVEQLSTRYISTKNEAPLQVEQFTLGVMKNSSEINIANLEEGNIENIDKKLLEQIKNQNPNLVFTSEEPSYTRTETIILNTELDEENAKVLMEKLKQDPNFMSQKTSEELSGMGIRIIRDLDDKQKTTSNEMEITNTRYSLNPNVIIGDNEESKAEDTKHSKLQKDHITEIHVSTPHTEKIIKHKSDLTKDNMSSKQITLSQIEEPILSYELDKELLTAFISNERYISAKQAEVKKRTISSNDSKKRHSDFDLPRNSHIKFRTATYEPPKGTIVTSTDLENRRLSQLDQMQLRGTSEQQTINPKPVISAKPSNIPVKQMEKPKLGVASGVSSKIPVFKSLSQENLTEKPFALPRSPPPQLSNSSGNISVTSIIKSSSRSPSGGNF